MIHVNRTRVQPPASLLERGPREVERARSEYSNSKGVPSVQFEFKAFRDREVRDRLLELFHHKCAFCEKPIPSAPDMEFEHFRPRWIAVNLDGAITKPAYWWLANEWSNLYPICRSCTAAKAERFPVEGPRADRIEAGERMTSVGGGGNPIRSIVYSGSGSSFITRHENGDLKHWEHGAKSSRLIATTSRLITIRVSHDGSRVVALGEPNLLLDWDVNRQNRHSVWEAHEQPVSALAINPAGTRAVTGAEDGEIAVWDLETAETVHRVTPSDRRINSIAVTPDGNRFFAAGDSGHLSVHDLETGELLSTYPSEGADLTGIVLMDRGERAAVQTSEGEIRYIDPETMEDLFFLSSKAIYGKGFTADRDGRYLTTWSEHQALVLDAYNRRIALELYTTRGVAAGTPDGRSLLLGEGDGFAQVSLDVCADERAILLDPCREWPEDYLVFDRNGRVASIRPGAEMAGSPTAAADRGQITIDIFGLNRSELIEMRASAAHDLEQLVIKLAGNYAADDPRLQVELEAYVQPNLPFSAMRRQLLPVFMEEQGIKVEPAEKTRERFRKQVQQHAVDAQISQEAFVNLGKYASEREVGCVEGETDRFESLQISRVEIKNFKCIEELTFDITGGGGDRAGWRVMLGENGVGKSSTLSAIALAVMGKRQLDQLVDLDQSKLLRRGADEGCVKVHFATDLEPVEIRFNKNGIEHVNIQTPRTYLLGFGSARWLPRPGSEEPETGACVRVRNLFNPFVPLTDALAWLEERKRELHYTKFRPIQNVINRLLLLESGTRILLRDDVLYLVRPEQELADADRLDEFSDGYQTILAIAVAILEMLGSKWNYEMEAADGLVLLDEIGSHLHPRWKLRIVDSLRSAFPRMQFIASTHEPLCLRGLGDGEVILLKKTRERKVYMVTDLPSVAGMQVEQLLTSEHFGLASTIDPELEGKFDRYYELLRKKSPDELEDPERKELEEIREFLARRRVLGTTRRERLMLDAIDRSLAKAEEGPDQRQAAMADLDTELANIIDQVDV